MNALVLNAYTDKHDGSVHLAGETVELTAARAKELSEAGFVRSEEAPKPRGRAKKTE